MIPSDQLPAFRETLLGGGYNLLLGSGVSLDSRNGRGELLRSSEQLRLDLCKLTGARETTTLSRAYGLLSADQRQEELVERFARSEPGPTVQHLPHFLWRRIFTFNVDDVLENLYLATATRKQQLISLNFDAPFEPTPNRNDLQVIHLHGSARKPASGVVFSSSEYVRVMSGLNPWMHLLSEILATEPFIIAGTSLNEIDLEFYLSHRNEATPRRSRGPSLLIEPYPDLVTTSDCNRYNLQLVHATFRDFMEWLTQEHPSPPTISDLIVPDVHTLFAERPRPIDLLRFFSDFELVSAADRPLPTTPSSFLNGQEPRWTDLDEHVDIERRSNPKISLELEKLVSSATPPARVITVLGDAGAGKTTSIKRVAHDYARRGHPVLAVRTLSRIDTKAATACLTKLTTQVVLLCDNLADHVDQLSDIVANATVASRVIVLGAERRYRSDYLDVVFGSIPTVRVLVPPLAYKESRQLIERYRSYGLIGDTGAMKRTTEFSERLVGDPIAVAVCRILRDFRSFDSIVESLLRAASAEDRLPYLCVALAQYCYWGGLRYSIAQSIMGWGRSIGALIDKQVPLQLAINPEHDEFVVTASAITGERILSRAVREAPKVVRAAFDRIANALAPHVNRQAVRARSPEARLAGRLFDADKIVKPLLGSAAEEFYISLQKQWEWNSRYWEQRALLLSSSDLPRALQYARHAVAIEVHPFPLTTLGKVLLMSMEHDASMRDVHFREAFDTLQTAIETAERYSRFSVHPFYTLLSGAIKFIELGGGLTAAQRASAAGYATQALHRFAGDKMIATAVQRLESLLAS